MPRHNKITRKEVKGLELNISFQPKQFKLLQAIRSGLCRYPFYGGAKGGGKSYASRLILLVMLLETPGTTGLLIRRTFKQLAGNHIRPLFMQFPDLEKRYNKSEGILYLDNGSQLLFGHCEHEDDVYQYQGQEFDYIGVEEVTQFTEFQWQMLSQSNRTSKRGLKPVMWATVEPGGIGHLWVKRLWVDRDFIQDVEDPEDYVFIPAKVFDNPALLSADPQYLRVLKSMRDPALRRAYLNGDWDIYPGQFFNKWDREQIAVPSFDIPDDWPLYGGLDYGESSPSSFGLYTTDYDGNVFRIMEYYQADRAASQHAEAIDELIDNCPFTGGRRPNIIYADPSMWVRRRMHEQHSKSATDYFVAAGLPLARANNDRVNGWRVCNDALVHKRFFAFDGWNDAFFRTVPGLPRDGRNPEDIVTVGVDDHCADEWRYAMVHNYRPGYTDPVQQYEGTMQELIDSVQTRPGSYGRYAN